MTQRILFVLTLGLLSAGALVAQHTTFPAQAEWLEKWSNSKAYTTEALQSLPDDQLAYRPSPGQMSVQEQVQHIAGNIYGLSRRYLGYQPAGFDEEALRDRLRAETLDRAALTSLLNDAYAFGAAAVRNTTPADWDKEVGNFFAGPKSQRVIIYLLQDHATHHRAQLLMYMRLLGLTPPRYRGW